eukprot:127788-Ditylum_brightwellii.AAC.1
MGKGKDDQKEEEFVYVGAQILDGNLDHTLDKQIDDVGERRSRGVLDVFGWKNESGDENIVDIQKFAYESKACIAGDGLFAPAQSRNNKVWWKILRGPVISAAHVGIANSFVSKAFAQGNQNDLFHKARRHLCQSLKSWKCNPSALLALANLTRMGVPIDGSNQNARAVHGRMIISMELYQAAAICGSCVRDYALNMLNDDSLSQDELFLMEAIVLGLGAQ